MSPSAVDRRTAAGEWQILFPSVYLLDAGPRSWEAKLVAAALWAGPGSAVSHQAAAAHWQMDGFPPGPLTLTTLRSLRPPPGIGFTALPRCRMRPPNGEGP